MIELGDTARTVRFVACRGNGALTSRSGFVLTARCGVRRPADCNRAVMGTLAVADTVGGAVHYARIDISTGVDGETVVLACLDLEQAEIAASSHAVTATAGERFRTADMSVDDVLELRELTALSDELAALALREGIDTVVMRPARLMAYRAALAWFIEARDEADWMREDDREALPRLRALLMPLEDLCAEAMRAALSPPNARRA